METGRPVDQTVDVVAEDSVKAHPEEPVDLAGVLSVPAQAPEAKPTEERHQTPAPVRLGEVHSVNSGI